MSPVTTEYLRSAFSQRRRPTHATGDTGYAVQLPLPPRAVELVPGTRLESAPGGIKESWRPQRDSNALDPSRWTHYGGGVMKTRTITYPTYGMLLLGLTGAGEVRLARVA